LAESVRKLGVKEPIVVTLDGFILSGHRRYAAAKLAGLAEVPVRVEPIRRSDDIDAFVVLLREYNRQRDKSLDEKLREEAVSVDPEDAYESLLTHRRERSEIEVESLHLGKGRQRKRISDGKREFADAIVKLVFDNRGYWPLSDRRIHYLLLNDPPLRHAKKPGSRYRNDLASYKDLTDMLVRLRLDGDENSLFPGMELFGTGGDPSIPMHAIDDETRSVTHWDVHPGVRPFMRGSLDSFLKGYWRDLMQSQPNHIEVIGEKNTVKPVIEPVAMRYTIPVTTGRGYCSLAPRAALAGRFERSGKEKLVILAASDADPEGMDIAESFGRSMRDDFGIDDVTVVKVALTPEQARELRLPEDTTAKLSSSRAANYVRRYGRHVWELEAIPPERLQAMLAEAIDAVIDTEAFNAELDAEKADAAWLEGTRRTVHKALQGVFDGIDSGQKGEKPD
jgi:hypothetical protein